jgi:hypothetical protein
MGDRAGSRGGEVFGRARQQAGALVVLRLVHGGKDPTLGVPSGTGRVGPRPGTRGLVAFEWISR